MKKKTSGKAIAGRIISCILMFFAILLLLSGSFIKTDSRESTKEVQGIFMNFKSKADAIGEYRKTYNDANMNYVIDGLGHIPIKRFTKTMDKMSAAFNNGGLSTREMIYPFAFSLIMPLDDLSKTDTYSISQRQAFYELEVFLIVITCAIILTLIIDVLAFFLKAFGKTGFFIGMAAALHFVIYIMMWMLALGLTGYMEWSYSDVIFKPAAAALWSFVFTFVAAIVARNMRDKKVKVKATEVKATEIKATEIKATEIKPIEIKAVEPQVTSNQVAVDGLKVENTVERADVCANADNSEDVTVYANVCGDENVSVCEELDNNENVTKEIEG